MSAPARLLFVVTTSDLGGTESFLLRLLAGLDRTAFAPEVLSLRPIGRVGQEIAALDIPVDSLHLQAGVRLAETVRAMAALRRRAARVDLVQTLLYRANVLTALAARSLPRSRRPVLVGSQRSLAPAGRSLDVRAQRLVRPWTDATVAVSRAVADEMQAHESIDPQRLRVIQNGVDTERFRPGDRAAARRRFHLPCNAPLVGAVGRLHGPKGVPILLEALARLRKDALPLAPDRTDPANPAERPHLVLAGDGPDAAKIDATIDRLGLGPVVHRLGRVDQPSALFPAFDAYALPSLAEGSPNALLEAMACGCAAVASSVGGVPEVLEPAGPEPSGAAHRVVGVTVPPGDPEALASALSRLLADPEQRLAIGQAARERVVEHFSLAAMISAHERLYRELLPP